MEKFINNNTNYTVRRTEYMGVPHIIVPVVMMREGVHNGSNGPTLHLASELGRIVSAWNGIPVTVQHPMLNGNHVSANLPEVLERESVGVILNSRMDGDALKAEAWINISRLSEVNEEAFNQILDQNPMDVSVGVFSDNEEITGVHNNESYESIARNHRPDHLALLPGEVGACSWQDGCGIRTNKKGGINVKQSSKSINNQVQFKGIEVNTSINKTIDWDKIDKEKISNYHLISSNEENKLLVVNAETDKLNKLALLSVLDSDSVEGVSQQGLLTAQIEAYHLLEENFDEKLGGSFENYLSKKYFVINQGFVALSRQLQRMLDGMDINGKLYYLEELYENDLVYRVSQDTGNTFFRQNYSVSNGEPVLTGDPIQVQREVSYIPLQNNEFKRTKINKNKEEKLMDNSKSPCQLAKVEQLINNSSTSFTEADKGWLLEQEESTLDKMMPKDSGVQINAEEGIEAFKKQLSNPDDFLNLMPTEMKESFKSGLSLHKQEKTKMIDHIMNNTENVWEKEQLEGMDFETLKNISKSVKAPIDYSLQGSRITEPPEVNNEDMLLPTGVEFDSQDKK